MKLRVLTATSKGKLLSIAEMLSKEGHPPSYILKPKSANKEVVVISKASTGHLHGGKVLMVSLKIGEHQAACFMGPETVKKYFSV